MIYKTKRRFFRKETKRTSINLNYNLHITIKSCRKRHEIHYRHHRSPMGTPFKPRKMAEGDYLPL